MELYKKSWYNNRRFIESSFDLKVDYHEPKGLRPRFIYGNLCNVQVYPNVRYCPNAICLENVKTVMNGTDEINDKGGWLVWCGTKDEPTTLKVGNWTIELDRYPKEKVLEILRQHIPSENFHNEEQV